MQDIAALLVLVPAVRNRHHERSGAAKRNQISGERVHPRLLHEEGGAGVDSNRGEHLNVERGLVKKKNKKEENIVNTYWHSLHVHVCVCLVGNIDKLTNWLVRVRMPFMCVGWKYVQFNLFCMY